MIRWRPLSALATLALGSALFLLGSTLGARPTAAAPAAQERCSPLESPDEAPSLGLIDFDDLPNGALIGDSYRASHGVRFEDSRTTRAIIYGNEPDEARSKPNVAINDAVSPNTSEGIPMRITFDEPKTHVGMWIGNGETQQLEGVLIGYDEKGEIICRAFSPAPEPHTAFIGLYDPAGRIASVTLDYGKTLLSD